MDILVFRSLLIKIIPFSTKQQLPVCLPDVIVTKGSHAALWSGYETLLINFKCSFLSACNYLSDISCNRAMEIYIEIID